MQKQNKKNVNKLNFIENTTKTQLNFYNKITSYNLYNGLNPIKHTAKHKFLGLQVINKQ